MEFLKEWTFWTLILAVASLGYSFFNMFVGRQVANKIMNNDLKHITADVNQLQNKSDKFEDLLDKKLELIFRELRKIDRRQVKRDAICDERHNIKR